MNMINILYFQIVGYGKVFPLTPQSQAIFDEVVLDKEANHCQQLLDWNERQNPKLLMQFLEETTKP